MKTGAIASGTHRALVIEAKREKCSVLHSSALLQQAANIMTRLCSFACSEAVMCDKKGRAVTVCVVLLEMLSP